MDVLGLGMVAEGLVVAGEAQQVFDPHGRGAQDVALERDAVHVPGDHLHHRFHAHFQEDFCGGHGTETHHRGLVVGDVHRVDVVFQEVGFVPEMIGVGAPGRPAFAGHGLLAALKDFFQFAPRGVFGGHCFNSSRIVVRNPPSRLVDQFL